MDNRRNEPRFEINQPVTVTKLEQPGNPLSGRLANFSTKGIRLILNEKLHPGTMVKVEWEGTTLLGEIMYCSQEVSEFAVGLELEDALYEKEEFASMFEAWAKS